jgi:steroid delta-isomerase-like uncharacterized protein
MNQEEMMALVERHLKAEGAGDVEGAVAVYTDDIVHDPVGFPGAPFHGRDAARGFYEHLTANFRTVDEEVLRSFVSGDALILDSMMSGDVIGEMMGLPGNDREITFRILHVFEFRDGLISGENVWIDTAAIIGQLSV